MSSTGDEIKFGEAINPQHAENAVAKLGGPQGSLRMTRVDFSACKHIDAAVGWRLGNAMRRHADASLLEIVLPDWDESDWRDTGQLWFRYFTRTGLGQAIAYRCDRVFRGAANVSEQLRAFYGGRGSEPQQNHFFSPGIRQRRPFNVDDFDDFLSHFEAAVKFVPTAARTLTSEFVNQLGSLVFEAVQNVWDHSCGRPLPPDTKVFDYLCVNFFKRLSSAPDPSGRFAGFVKQTSAEFSASQKLLGYVEVVVNDDGVGVAARQSLDPTIYWDDDPSREGEALLESLQRGKSVKFKSQDCPIRHDPGFGISKIVKSLRDLRAFAVLRTGRRIAIHDPYELTSDGLILTNDILGYLPGTALDVIAPIPDPQRRLF